MLTLGPSGLRVAPARPSVACHVATPSRPPASRLAKRSKVEIIKEESDFLRHPLMSELVDEKTYISEEAVQLMKFHGSYQQDHREKRAFGQGKFYQFMMRTRQPGGLVTNQLYLAMDDLADMVRFTRFGVALCSRGAHVLQPFERVAVAALTNAAPARPAARPQPAQSPRRCVPLT